MYKKKKKPKQTLLPTKSMIRKGNPKGTSVLERICERGEFLLLSLE